MPSIEIPLAYATFAANGLANGTIQMADTSGFYPGAIAYLNDVNGKSAEVKIISIVDATHLKVRITDTLSKTPGKSYGLSDVSGWTLANAATITQNPQLCQVEPNNIAKMAFIP